MTNLQKDEIQKIAHDRPMIDNLRFAMKLKAEMRKNVYGGRWDDLGKVLDRI